MTIPHMKKIQTCFEDSNLELDLEKDANRYYLCEITRYSWRNWMTAYSLGREHQANIASKATEIAQAEATPTCQVQLIGGEVQTMTREKAKALQAETRDTHDWFYPSGDFDRIMFHFNAAGIYTYLPKAKKVISWSLPHAPAMGNLKK